MSNNDAEDLAIQNTSSGDGSNQSVSENQNEPAVLVERRTSSIVAQSGQSYHPIFEKFESEHVSQFLKNKSENDAAARRLTSTDRNYGLIYFFTFVGIFVLLMVILLPDHKELFIDIVTVIGSLIAGGFGGYGLHAYQSKRREREP